MVVLVRGRLAQDGGLPWREVPFQRVNSYGIVPVAILLNIDVLISLCLLQKGVLCCAHMTSDPFAPSTLDKP